MKFMVLYEYQIMIRAVTVVYEGTLVYMIMFNSLYIESIPCSLDHTFH